MNIYEIDNRILELVDMETGEILDYEAFAELKMEREAKIENAVCYVKNLVADAAAIRAEEVALAERRRSIERKVERLKDYVARALDGQKFETSRCAVSWRKTTSVAITDEAAVIDWAQRMNRDDILKYSAPSVNKAELMKLLKSDMEVPGAEIAVGMSMGVK